MEIKEAIAILARIQEPEAWGPQITREAWQALEMAKEALVKESQGLVKDSVKDLPDISVGNCSGIPNGSDTISRQQAIKAIEESKIKVWLNHYDHDDGYNEGLETALEEIKNLPSAQPDIAEKLYQYKCYITDQEGLQHEVIHVGDIRRVTGWEI